MAIEKVLIERFLQLTELHPVFDVRSPSEYLHAHIPGAHSLPLFTDEERKVVGTAYKQQSREAAIKIGLDFFGPKMRGMVEVVEEKYSGLISNASGLSQYNQQVVLVHCWRGGMRSAALAWLLDLYGYKVVTLAGGYKKFRNFVLDSFTYPYQFNILGGFTGSGKTMVLEQLARSGYPVIDLEQLAHHKGSAFGAISQPPQPTQEMFENKLALNLYKSFHLSRYRLYENIPAVLEGLEVEGREIPVWVEDESQRIGSVNIPQPLWNTMRRAPVHFLSIPFEARLEHLVKGYGGLDKEKMLHAIIRIKKRLGGLETKMAVNFLIEDNIRECFRVLLVYYDKHYSKALHNREEYQGLIHTIESEEVNPVKNSGKLHDVQQTFTIK